MDQIDVDEIADVTFSGESKETVDITFKDGSLKTYSGAEHPEIFELLNHWTPPTA